MSKENTTIISLPDQDNPVVSGENAEYGFGYCENQGNRSEQEDTLVWHLLSEADLTAKGTLTSLSPEQIGHRLWTSYLIIDEQRDESGATASTTIYDGKGNLITATLADTVSFAAVYGKDGKVINVIRLNSVTHNPTLPGETARVEAAGGRIVKNRVAFIPQKPSIGSIAVSRAIGDDYYKEKGWLIAESTIDITNFDKIAADCNIDKENIDKIQIISTCDGYTEPAGEKKQTKEDHEAFLLSNLKEIEEAKGTQLSPRELAEALSASALAKGSNDNVSVAVQSLTLDSKNPVFLGVYDGHGGSVTSILTAQNIVRVFKEQCALSLSAYAAQELSVHRKQAAFERDNQPLSAEVMHLAEERPIIKVVESVNEVEVTDVRGVQELVNPVSAAVSSSLASKSSAKCDISELDLSNVATFEDFERLYPDFEPRFDFKNFVAMSRAYPFIGNEGRQYERPVKKISELERMVSPSASYKKVGDQYVAAWTHMYNISDLQAISPDELDIRLYEDEDFVILPKHASRHDLGIAKIGKLLIEYAGNGGDTYTIRIQEIDKNDKKLIPFLSLKATSYPEVQFECLLPFSLITVNSSNTMTSSLNSNHSFESLSYAYEVKTILTKCMFNQDISLEERESVVANCKKIKKLEVFDPNFDPHRAESRPVQNPINEVVDIKTEVDLASHEQDVKSDFENVTIPAGHAETLDVVGTLEADQPVNGSHQEIPQKLQVQLDLILQKSINMHYYAVELRKQNNFRKASQVQEASNSAYKLHEAITAAAVDHYVNKNSTLKEFGDACTEVIAEVRPVLETHRGWKEILGNLALFIAGLGVGFVVAGLINKAVTGNFLFFKTDSEEKLDALEHTVKELAAPSGRN
ncbi:protein phosphatase 2C family protein [Legionella bononiensis]|uniref:Protein phosphatase 2C family protein n=1 Tax=Legionella bononiensis TaxID=2793102 RepID=A0ABS1WCN2_9GAMM|nr:protein phosphatase 2C family protein [Legionella bononiensis]MBL7478981.1 protein phosphatase 2C family protein [Legionella bononiensis]MBL7527113.1 protein phosphatase 2C family protein [Legionella bononiensis]MBL7562082.1 protein phosphatase 2C family protein [Legionella bononiensis]